MRFEYCLRDNLPRLAWCAEVRRGSEEVRVVHGPWVETRSDRFFEGAWNESFSEGRFEEAHTFTGSGGCLTPQGVLFAGPTHTIEHLYTLSVADKMWVSNSWVFVLASADDSPDIANPDYYYYFRYYNRLGLAKTHKPVPTAGGNQVVLHDCANILVRHDLSLQRREKSLPAQFSNFTEYVDLLGSTVEGVLRNAIDPERMWKYRAVTSISRGYDSTAVSALAARAGCREAVTFAGPDADDDGTPIARRLGLSVHAFDRFAYKELPDRPEAEFCFAAPTTWVPFRSMESVLEGSLMITGLRGTAWTPRPNCLAPKFQAIAFYYFPGNTMTEFRLRCGFFTFHPIFAGLQHDRSLRSVIRSRELLPFEIGQDGEKPLARRIVEEAGVPRALFGQKKMASAFQYGKDVHELSPSSRADFEGFCVAHSIPLVPRARGIGDRLAATVCRFLSRVDGWLVCYLHPNLYNRILPGLYWLDQPPGEPFWRSPMLYLLHWSFDRLKGRYKVA